jgi:type VI secretion system protein ImpF
MSEALRPGRFAERVRESGARVRLPLLDRLLDEAPELEHDRPLSPSEAMLVLKRAVRRDLEALLNAKRRWRSPPRGLDLLASANTGYGLPDYTSGGIAGTRRQAFRAEVERTIRLFEPRLSQVSVVLIEDREALDATLHLRIDGLLHAEPAPEPVSFDTLADPATADIAVKGDQFV